MKRKLEVLVATAVSSAALAGVATAASTPTVLTGSHAKTTDTSVVLYGTVDPNGSKTYYVFQWGLTSAYGLASSGRSAGGGTDSVSVQAAPSGLIPGTTYHYRLVALNRFGSSTGADRTFTTAGHPPPGVSTGPATGIGRSSATVTGIVDPNGENTTWVFQYGPTAAYGYQTFGGTAPAGNAPQTVSVPLLALAPGTIFHYRIVAQHGGFEAQYGLDGTFMTYPTTRAQPRVKARTVPGRARRRPYVFTTSGRVIGPAAIAGAFDCSGYVVIRFLLGKRTVAFSLAPIQTDCAFATETLFNRVPGRGRAHGRVGLRVVVRFRGNGYLRPADARPARAVLG